MYGELSKILDILNRGYGCFHVDNSLILISFNMESKSFISKCSGSVVFEERIGRAKKLIKKMLEHMSSKALIGKSLSFIFNIKGYQKPNITCVI